MVLQYRNCKMASEQPVKKKLRRTDNAEPTDEPDYIHNLTENGTRPDFSTIHLPLPVNVNEADITFNSLNLQLCDALIDTSKSVLNKTVEEINSQVHTNNSAVPFANTSGITNCNRSANSKFKNGVCVSPNIIPDNFASQPCSNSHITHSCTYIPNCENVNIKPAPDILCAATVSQPVFAGCANNFLPSLAFKSCLVSNINTCTSADLNCHSVRSKAHVITNHDRQLINNDNIEYNQQLAIPVSQNNKSAFRIPPSFDAEQMIRESDGEGDLDIFRNHLIKQCLCGISESTLQKFFENRSGTNGTRSIAIAEWQTVEALQFLSLLQLMFDIYLKQNNRGFICSRIAHICDTIVYNEYNLVEQIITLCEKSNAYINYLSAKVVSSFLIIAKTNVNNEWLETLINYLTSENTDYVKINFALEVMKRVVEWKDVEIHVLEESNVSHDGASTSSQEMDVSSNCTAVPYSDSESYDTSCIKGLIIKSLECKWPDLINKIQYLIAHNSSVQSQTCILTFLALWESTISVKANLSVIDTKPFYAHLEIFVQLLNSSLPPIIWKHLLSLFNEVLCYGSTLALQDMLPDDTCQLAHLIVRYVKDFRLLDSLPFRSEEGFIVHSFIGTIPSLHTSEFCTDKTLLQKMVLLVLKSVAITIKETRSDSSDSSVGSDDYDFYQDMQLIERSIRDVLKKVDIFIKNSLDFHPESPFSKVLVHLFSDQDDYMIESMVCTLDITVGISYRNAVFPDLISMLNPTYSFVEFLKIVSHDSDVLLDYLVSNETCFLLYLLRFLKYTRRNWSKFVSSCESSGNSSRSHELDNTMTVLIRLKMQINRLVTKDLFPYNISPVLRLLEVCESLYEGNEYS